MERTTSRESGSCIDHGPVASVCGDPVAAKATHASIISSASASALASEPQNSARYWLASWLPLRIHAQIRAQSVWACGI